MTDERRFPTTGEAARRLGLTARTLERYRRADLDAWAAAEGGRR